MVSPGRENQILIVGVGKALLAENGIGGAVAKPRGRTLPVGEATAAVQCAADTVLKQVSERQSNCGYGG